MIIDKVLVPLLNANEPEAQLIAIHVKNGQLMNKGDILFTMETTKATSDIESPVSGYIWIRAEIGGNYSVGTILAVISDLADEMDRMKENETQEVYQNVRITEPARELAKHLGIEIDELPTNKLITESIIKEYFNQKEPAMDIPIFSISDNSIVVYGGGGHAKTIMELIKAMGKFSLVGIIDDKIPKNTIIHGNIVFGGREVIPTLADKGLNLAAIGVGGILDTQERVNLFDLMERHGFSFPPLIHPSASIEYSSIIEEGVQVFSNAYIGSDTILRSRCMVNSNAVVSHDCEIGAYSHIAPGALLAGHVQVGEKSLVGMGVTVAIGTRIGTLVRIGNGAIVYSDVPDRTIIPAGKVWAGTN